MKHWCKCQGFLVAFYWEPVNFPFEYFNGCTDTEVTSIDLVTQMKSVKGWPHWASSISGSGSGQYKSMVIFPKCQPKHQAASLKFAACCSVCSCPYLFICYWVQIGLKESYGYIHFVMMSAQRGSSFWCTLLWGSIQQSFSAPIIWPYISLIIFYICWDLWFPNKSTITVKASL